MTSYGEPHAGDYDGYQQPAGRAPSPSYDAYGYQDSGNPNQGWQDQGGYANDYHDPGYYAAPVTARASVPVVSGRASVPVANGRASVPLATGRATVRPASTHDDSLDDLDRSKKAKKKKRARRQKLLIASLGVFILLIGGGMIGGSYIYDDVKMPEELTLVNSTEIFATNGKQLEQIAKLGTEQRTEVAMSQLPKKVRDALIAGEDKNFYEHHGVDLWGIARAAWNNITGGETQGASTITQQYARRAANDMDVTYARKVREAIMARKLEDEFNKEQILGFYLNTVYFGRGAHGVGAAFEAYFNLPVEKINEMTVAQAAVLGAVVRNPEGKDGYDPAENPGNAKGRWEYVLNNMVEMGWLTPEERAQLKYPEPVDPKNPKPGELQPPKENAGGATGYTDRGTGFVVNYIGDELEEKGIVDLLKKSGYDNWKNAGLKITTTIDLRAQAALEAQLNKAIPTSSLAKQRPNVIGAGVAIDPKTGAVLAYYGGGNNGSLDDYADDEHPHQPASSGKIYTLAAAIENGISINSRWDPTALKKSNGDDFDVGNANREGDDSCQTWCTLEEMTIKSYNVPFFKIAKAIGPHKVANMAGAAGVSHMWATAPELKAYDLAKGIPPGRAPFDYHIGFGQYPISVIDHATGTATIANHGVYHKPYFIRRVEQKNKQTGEWERIPLGDEQIKGEQRIRPEVADEVTSVLKQIPTGRYALRGRQGAGKTGTWENGNSKSKDPKVRRKYSGTNAHAWFTGYTPQIAATIWIGSSDVNTTPIKENTGKKDLFDEDDITSSYPKLLWKQFMDQAHKAMGLKPERLASGSNGRIGSADAGDGVSPTPSPPECGWFFCPTDRPGDPGGGGGPTKPPRDPPPPDD